MAMKTALRITGWSLAGMALFTAGFALGQYPAPTEYKGVEESVLAALDLAKEIDSVENRELRVSRAIVAPGGHIGLHSHQGDPTIVYVLDGVLTNHHDDGTTEEFRSGQVFAEFGPRSHWVENNGLTPVIFIRKHSSARIGTAGSRLTKVREVIMFKRIDQVEIVTDQLGSNRAVLHRTVKARDRIESSGLGVPTDLVYLDRRHRRRADRVRRHCCRPCSTG
jgi:quercetin dioxygenase-like cupin family protein